MRSSLLMASILCVIVGAFGGALSMVLTHASFITGVGLGGLYGLVFALLCVPRAVNAGAGIVWGLGYSFILWLALPAGFLPVMMGGMPAMDRLRVGFSPSRIRSTLNPKVPACASCTR